MLTQNVTLKYKKKFRHFQINIVKCNTNGEPQGKEYWTQKEGMVNMTEWWERNG